MEDRLVEGRLVEDRLVQIVALPSTSKFLNIGVNEAQQNLSRRGIDLGHALKHYIAHSMKLPSTYEIHLKSENASYNGTFYDKNQSLAGFRLGIEEYLENEDAPYVVLTYKSSLEPIKELLMGYSGNIQIYEA